MTAEIIRRPIPNAVILPKQALADYWRRTADRALPYLSRRLLKLVRAEDGIVFYHDGPLPPLAPAVHTLTIEKRTGGTGIRPWIDSLDGLLGLVEMDVVEIHPWGSTVEDIEHPDMLVFDLHPGEGVGWPFVAETALRLRDILAADDLDAWPKTTGDVDLHIHVPFDRSLNWDGARAYAKMVAQQLAEGAPERFTFEVGEAKRRGRILIDYLRNGRGSTAIGAYSPVAVRGFPVASPLTWRELEAAEPPRRTMVP